MKKKTEVLHRARYQLYELTAEQHDYYHLRPCELCAFGMKNSGDGRFCGAELFRTCVERLGRQAFFLENTPEARKTAVNRIRARVSKYSPARDPFDHHDPYYDEHWLENNIDNYTYPDND